MSTTTSPGGAVEHPHKHFLYEAQSPAGQTLRGTLEAPNIADARDQLQALGLRVLSLVLSREAAPPRRLSADDFILFNQQLAHLTQAGMPVEHGLRLIAADLRSGRLAAASRAVADELERGAPLQEAFARHQKEFPALYARLVDAGVQTGNLPGMLFNLGRHLELVHRIRFALWRVIAYPAIALVALSIVLLFIAIRILPQFEEMFRDFGTRLPPITLFILWLGRIAPMAFIVLALIVAAVVLVFISLRATNKMGHVIDYFLVPMPIIGPVLKASILARWCDALRLAVDSGLDLPRGIVLASDTIGSPRLQQDGADLIASISAGNNFETFRSRLLPATVPAAIQLSSQTGDLASTLGTITHMYEQQAEHRLRLIPVLLTPIMMIIVASAIGFSVFALFMPLVKLVSSVSGGF